VRTRPTGSAVNYSANYQTNATTNPIALSQLQYHAYFKGASEILAKRSTKYVAVSRAFSGEYQLDNHLLRQSDTVHYHCSFLLGLLATEGYSPSQHRRGAFRWLGQGLDTHHSYWYWGSPSWGCPFVALTMNPHKLAQDETTELPFTHYRST
jgi:hypothetical protein